MSPKANFYFRLSNFSYSFFSPNKSASKEEGAIISCRGPDKVKKREKEGQKSNPEKIIAK